jgi:uncharacterized protein YegP (UPF0339 family)
MPYFTLFKDVENQWRWRLKADNHKVIATSEACERRESCVHSIRVVKSEVRKAAVYDTTKDPWERVSGT